MEIIIALVVVAGLVYWFFFRKSEVAAVEVAPVAEAVSAPYKMPEPEPVTIIPLVVEAAPEVVAPVAVVAPVKKPRKPRAAPVAAVVAKPAAKAKTVAKKVAVIKAAPKKAVAVKAAPAAKTKSKKA